jgi:t-SNARE complex subunit (syntaxin)
MHKRIRTLAELKNHLDGFISQEATLFAELCKARENGKLEHFQRWNSVSYHLAVVRASAAERYLEFILAQPEANEGEPVEAVSDEEKLRRISEEVSNYMMGLDLRLVSRSGSASHNIADDAEKSVWLELYQMLNSGY